jgi:hypothetical protein
MKKLNKLQINSEKLMKNEELMTLRGGYGSVTCYNGSSQCGWTGLVGNCSMAYEACERMCFGNWTHSICAG